MDLLGYVIDILLQANSNQLMNVSSQRVEFVQSEDLKRIWLQNTSNCMMIFKLKITNNDLFSITPGKGIIKPTQKTYINIKLNKTCNIMAKLLISYALFQQLTQESIDLQLARIDKEILQNKIIPITRTYTKEKQQNNEEKHIFKKTSSPIYEVDIGAEQKTESNDNNSKNFSQVNLKKSLTLRSNSNMFKSIIDLDKRQTQQPISSQSLKLQKQLESERSKIKKMQQRLIQKEKKIMYYNNLRQIQINRSLNRKQETIESNCCNYTLAAFICIMIGFFLSKYNFSQQFSL